MPWAPAVRGLNPLRVIPSKGGVPLTLTVQISPAAPVAYALYAQQGQKVGVSVTNTATMKILDAQGQALTFPGQSVQYPVGRTGDYIIMITGAGVVTTTIALSPP